MIRKIILFFILVFSVKSQNTIHWARKVQVQTPGSLSVHVVASDKQGNTFMGGTFTYTQDLNFTSGVYTVNNNSSSYAASFISKYDKFGNFLWAYPFIDNLGNFVSFGNLYVDDSSNIVLTFYFQGIVDFDVGPGTYTIMGGGFNNNDAVIAKYDNNCNLKWAGKIAGYSSPSESIQGLVFDTLCNIYITGLCNTCDLDITPSTNTVSGTGIFLAKYNPMGQLQFMHFYKDNQVTSRLDINRKTQDIYVIAQISATTDIDPSPTATITNGSNSLTVIRYSSVGQYKSKYFLNSLLYPSEYKDFKVTKKGDLFLGIDFKNSIDLDPGPGTVSITSYFSNTLDFCLVKYDSLGALKKWFQVGNNDDDKIISISINDSDQVCIYGEARYSCDFDPSPTQTLNLYTSGKEVYVAKYDDTLGLKFAFRIFNNQHPTTPYFMRFGKYNELYITTGMNGNSVFDFDPSPGTYTIQGSGLAVAKYIYPNSIPTNFTKNVPIHPNFMLYPNPTNGKLFIKVNEPGNYEIIDIVGKLVNKLILESGINEINLNLDEGIYFLRNYEMNQIQKIIIKN